jgi:hypothetical protein
MCLPNYDRDIKGRVLLDLLNEPDGVDLTWSGNDIRPPLTNYLLTVMDAIDKHTPNQAVYLLQVCAELACTCFICNSPYTP